MEENLHIQRIGLETEHASLQAYSKADEYLLQMQDQLSDSPLFIHDRYGYLSCHLAHLHPYQLTNYRHQESAISVNHATNGLASPTIYRLDQPLPRRIKHSVMKVPKSMGLYHQYLRYIHRHATADFVGYAGFMTRHFSPKIVSLAERYFDTVSQSRAWKKARILQFAAPRHVDSQDLLLRDLQLQYRDDTIRLRHHLGVFSGRKIDEATELLIQHLPEDIKPRTVLDLACGNGVIGVAAQHLYPEAHVHFVDDHYLAIASAKVNAAKNRSSFHYSNGLEGFSGSVDLILCNPPFHFEHENTITIAHRLFADAKRVLTSDGRLIIVANRHLNYRTYLSEIFSVAHPIASHPKYELLVCTS